MYQTQKCFLNYNYRFSHFITMALLLSGHVGRQVPNFWQISSFFRHFDNQSCFSLSSQSFFFQIIYLTYLPNQMKLSEHECFFSSIIIRKYDCTIYYFSVMSVSIIQKYKIDDISNSDFSIFLGRSEQISDHDCQIYYIAFVDLCQQCA